MTARSFAAQNGGQDGSEPLYSTGFCALCPGSNRPIATDIVVDRKQSGFLTVFGDPATP